MSSPLSVSPLIKTHPQAQDYTMPPKKSDSDLQSSTLTAPTSSAAGEQGVVAQDLFYDNPKADLIILSSDGVIFRVDAWTFAKKR